MSTEKIQEDWSNAKVFAVVASLIGGGMAFVSFLQWFTQATVTGHALAAWADVHPLVIAIFIAFGPLLTGIAMVKIMVANFDRNRMTKEN